MAEAISVFDGIDERDVIGLSVVQSSHSRAIDIGWIKE